MNIGSHFPLDFLLVKGNNAIERFSNDCRKNDTLTNHTRSEQRNEPIRIPSNYLSLAQSAGKIVRLVLLLIGWKNWREISKPITKRSNRNRVISFDSYLKPTLKQ